MSVLPSKAIRDGYGIDTYLRGMVWGVMALRSLLVAADDGDKGLVQWTLNSGSGDIGRFTGSATFRYAQLSNTTQALDLIAAIAPLNDGTPDPWTKPADPTPDLGDPIPVEPNGFSLEQYVAWCAYALEYLSLPSTNVIRWQIQDANPIAPTAIVTFSLPFSRSRYLNTRNILEAAIDTSDPPTFSNTAIAWSRLTGVPTEFPPSDHLHQLDDVEELVDVLAGKADLGVDGKVLPDQLPANNGQGVSSWNDLTDKPTEFPPSAHLHQLEDVEELVDVLADKADLGVDGKVLPSQLPSGLGDGWQLTQTKTANYSAQGYEQIPCDTTTSAFSLTLPDSDQPIWVFDAGGETSVSGFYTNNLTIVPTNPDTIMGSSTLVLDRGAISVILQRINTDWRIING